jgi:hypothetical protein
MLRQAVLPFFEMTQDRSWLRNLLLVVGGSFLISLFARIAIPLPFSDVPIALQGHVCLLLGVLFGSRIGALTVLTYILQGSRPSRLCIGKSRDPYSSRTYRWISDGLCFGNVGDRLSGREIRFQKPTSSDAGDGDWEPTDLSLRPFSVISFRGS